MDPSAKQGGTNGDPGVQLMNGEGRVSALVLRSACGWLPSLRFDSGGWSTSLSASIPILP